MSASLQRWSGLVSRCVPQIEAIVAVTTTLLIVPAPAAKRRARSVPLTAISMSAFSSIVPVTSTGEATCAMPTQPVTCRAPRHHLGISTS